MPENTNKDKLSNYSLDLDGNSNYINFTETEFLNNGQASFSFWIKPESYGGNNYGYFFSGATSTQGGIAYSEGSSSGPYYPGVLYWYNGSVSTVLDVVVTENVWNHIVVVFDGTSLKTYKDGSLGTTKTITAATTLAFDTIGRYNNNATHYINGSISEFSVFDYAVSQEQVTYLYNLNNPMAITGAKPIAYYPLGDNSNPRALAGYPNLAVDSTTPYSNYSVSFNGGTEYMRTPTSYGSYFSGATSCSVSVWAKLDNTTAQHPVLSCWYTNAADKSYLIRYVNDSRRFQFYLWGPVGAGDSRFGLANTGVNISANRWYHIVGTWDGTTIKIYQDGVFAGSESAPGGALQTVNQQNWTGQYNGVYMQGDVSNQAFWKNTVLTQSEITEIYNAGVTTDLNNFSGTAPNVWYPMDENSTYFPGVDHPTDLYIRDVMSDRYSAGLNMDTSNFVGNAPGSSANGTGNNLDISNLKGDMSNSIKNSYSINMADYGDPNGQGLTPANSGRTTDVPGSVDPGGQFSPFNTSTTPRGFEGDACEDSNDGQFYTEEFPPQPVIPFVGAIVYTDAAGTGYPEEGYYSQFIEEYNIKVYYEIGANGEVTNSDMCI